MGRYGLGCWCVLSLASDFRAVWLVWLQVGKRASGKAFGAKTMRLNEGLDYHDMEGQIDDNITVDEYAAKMGKDSEIVTLTFKVNSKLAADDLVSWLEIGYDFILDASVSEGEIEPGKWLVFVEMKRKSNIPRKIVEVLEDLKTLTDKDVKDYTIHVNDKSYDADVDVLKQVIILSPTEYANKKEKEEELNEMRAIAGIKTKTLYNNDTYIKNLKSIAGL